MTSTDKVVLITGCSLGGIGYALAKEYRSRGCRVFATARRLEAMEGLAELGVETMTLDVKDVKSIRELRDKIAMLTGGKLDILVNNAGRGYSVALSDVDMDEVRDVFEVNVFAPMTMVQEFLELLISSRDARIVQSGSITGFMPVPFGVAYNTSKAALHHLSNTLRVELAPFNIKVINVVGGGVKSNISKPTELPENSLYRPMEQMYQERRLGRSQVGAIPAEEYASFVVTESLKQNPRAWIWVGHNSFLTWFIDVFFVRTGFDWLMNRTFGMDLFASMIARQGGARLS